MPNFVSRKLRSKGFGIHSPFAFEFVTKVLSCRTHYYAFSEIKKLLSKHQLSGFISEINFLSFRIIHYLKPTSVLEIGAEKGVNALFMSAPSKQINCTCVERDERSREIGCKLTENWKRNISFLKTLPESEMQFDVIFLHLHSFSENPEAVLNWMTVHSHQKTCWIFSGIHTNRVNRAFWKRIMKNERTSVCFDKSQIGIAFLDISYHKLNYFV